MHQRFQDLTRAQQHDVAAIVDDAIQGYDRNRMVEHVREGIHHIYIGRPMAGHQAVGWGNSFTLKDYTHLPTSPEHQRHYCILDYTANLLYGDQRHLLKRLPELKGKVLGCWCSPRLCHGHVLTYLAHHVEFF